MRRWIAVLWHGSFLIIAAALYFFFVLPRWYELTGAWGAPLGLSMRIVCGALIGLAALPVVFTLLRTRKPEFGTPQLALTLRFWSIVLHVLAGVLIIGAAIGELWFSLDTAGVYLFGVYGAAAAVALLGALGFDLAFVAELPPPPPKPLKPRTQTRGRGRRKQAAAGDVDDERGEVGDDVPRDTTVAEDAAEVPDPIETSNETGIETNEVTAPESSEADDTIVDDDEPTVTAADDHQHDNGDDHDAVPDTETSSNGSGNAGDSDADEQGSTLRNRRPGGKPTSRLFGRSSRKIALDD